MFFLICMGIFVERVLELSRPFPLDIGGSYWSVTDEWMINELGMRVHDEWMDTLEWGGAMLDCSYMDYLWNEGEVYLVCDQDGLHRHECWREVPAIRYAPTVDFGF